jgi:hypothetical protein
MKTIYGTLVNARKSLDLMDETLHRQANEVTYVKALLVSALQEVEEYLAKKEEMNKNLGNLFEYKVSDFQHDVMDYRKFNNIIVNEISTRWNKDYPEYLIYPRTQDKKEHDRAQDGPSKFLCSCLNRVSNTQFNRSGYHIEDVERLIDGADQAKERFRLITDIRTCPDLRIWMIETIGA